MVQNHKNYADNPYQPDPDDSPGGKELPLRTSG